MEKKIVWSLAAIQDRAAIYHYWADRNKSLIYSEKLEQMFNDGASLIAKFPNVGIQTNYKSIRVKHIRTFKLFYRCVQDEIEIIRILDSRQDPGRMPFTNP